MKTNGAKPFVGIALTLVLAGSVGEFRSLAAWNSIRANNRSQAESRALPRTAPVVPNREHETEVRPNFQRPAESNRSRAEREKSRGEREERRGVISAPREEHGRELRVGRRFDYDEDRRHLYPWSHYRPGVIINTLPLGYVPLEVGGTPFYYSGGTYYETSPSGYVVVAPPVGAVVPELPPGAEEIVAGPNVFYYAAGAFYAPQPQGGFVVITPPLGVTVGELPAGAIPVAINGAVYYQADGAYFLPVMQGGVTVYTTVQP